MVDHLSGFARDFTYRRKYALDPFRISARKATALERLEPFGRYRRSLAKLISAHSPFHERSYVQQEGIDFDPRLLDVKVSGTVYLDGLWQSENYFKDVQDVIRADLQITPSQDTANQSMAEQIKTVNSVGVHVRWFDRSTNVLVSAYNLQPAYYVRAAESIRARVTAPHFFIFSDDTDAATKIPGLPKDSVTWVNHNRRDDNAHADLWLMSLCKHFIIANSTFSWWGAWLGSSNSGIVISPGVSSFNGTCGWGFDGLIPSRWIILP